MGGFFGVASQQDCVFDLFLELTTIPIWEHDAVEWRYTEKKDLIGQSIILKMLRFELNLIKMSVK